MSDLQLALVVIGALVIVGVYAFNRLQERQFRRRMERAFQDRPEDVLIAPVKARASEERVEPHVGAHSAAPASEEALAIAADSESAHDPTPTHSTTAAPAATTSKPAFAIDFVCHLESVTALPSAALAELLRSMHALGKPVSLRAWNPDAAEWVALASNAPREITRVEAALQLADRTGPVNRVQLSTMCDLMREFAEQSDARCHCPEIDAAAQAATELDRFCAEVDVSIGCTVVPAAGPGFPGTKVRGLLESYGFALDSSGRFVLRSDEGNALLSIEDIEGHPFSAERMRSATLGGLVLTLDVPRVPANSRIFDRMVEVGRHLAQALDGTVVDDNRAALTEAGLKLVRQQLRGLHETMQAQGIPAGGALAARLFS